MNLFLRRLAVLLVYAYPSEFRTEYGASVIEHFSEDCTDWRLGLRTSIEILASAIAMHAEMLWRDLSFAWRMSLKAPVFTAIVAGTIAVAIGAGAAIFSLLDAVLLQPLPYPHADRLGVVWQSAYNPALGRGITVQAGYDAIESLARQAKFFSGVAASDPDVGGGPPGFAANSHSQNRLLVTSNYFDVLGIKPELGRFFDSPRQLNQAVISDRLWHSKYGGSSTVLGRRLKVDDNLYTIVGVAPSGFVDRTPSGLTTDDVWMELNVNGGGGPSQFQVGTATVRLRDGVSWAAAAAEVNRLRWSFSHDPLAPPTTAMIRPLNDLLFETAKAFFWIAFGAVAGLLLICCANVANLMLARASARMSEFSVRASVGASRLRIAKQLLIETLLLAGIGGAAGLALARAALPLAVRIVPQNLPRLQNAAIDGRVFAFVCLTSLAVALISGIVPALAVTAKRRTGDGSRMRTILVALEISVAFTLTVGLGLLLRSYLTMTAVNVGFNADNLYAASFVPKGYAHVWHHIDPQTGMTVAGRIAAIPGVKSATIGTSLPFTPGMMMIFPIVPAGKVVPRISEPPVVAQVGPNFFSVMQTPILSGRPFESRDLTGSPVAVVSEAYAREFFPRTNPVGKYLKSDSGTLIRVVGVSADVRSSVVGDPQTMIYMLPLQNAFGPYYQVAIRTSGPTPDLANEIALALKGLPAVKDPPIISSMRQGVQADALRSETSFALLGVLAGLAVLLAICGVFGVVTYDTQRRYHEVGIRMAIGSTRGRVVSRIVNRALLQCAGGVAVGIVFAALTTRLLQSQLFTVSPLDPLTFAGVTAGTLLCTVAAASFPAWRATRTEPSTILRYE